MIFRVIMAVVASLCTVLIVRKIPTLVADRLFLILIVPVATVAALGWWFAVRGDNQEVRAMVTAGLLSGFIGPMFLDPSSPQGPLLGFIVGPVGFVVGSIAGVVLARMRQRFRN
jgi:hypothetical protein